MELEVNVGARVFAITFMENTLDGKVIGSEVVTHSEGFSILEMVGLLEMLKQRLLNQNEDNLAHQAAKRLRKEQKDGDEKQKQSKTTG